MLFLESLNGQICRCRTYLNKPMPAAFSLKVVSDKSWLYELRCQYFDETSARRYLQLEFAGFERILSSCLISNSRAFLDVYLWITDLFYTESGK